MVVWDISFTTVLPTYCGNLESVPETPALANPLRVRGMGGRNRVQKISLILKTTSAFPM